MFTHNMPPTNLAALHPDSSPLQQLYDFAKQHDGEHIVIDYAPGEDGTTPHQLCGILNANLITASGCQYPTGKRILFPLTHQRYLSIMTSRDGQNIYGQLNPDVRPRHHASQHGPLCPSVQRSSWSRGMGSVVGTRRVVPSAVVAYSM